MKLGIILPTRGIILTETMLGMIEILKRGAQLFVSKDLPIPDNLNQLVNEALQSDITHLLFINDDIVVTPELIAEMEKVKKDIVVAPYLLDNNMPDYSISNGEITHAGLGCALIKREVFEKLKKPYFRTDMTITTFGGQEIINKNDGREWGGEDAYFYYMCRQAGFKIHKIDLMPKHLRIISWGKKNANQGVHRIKTIGENFNAKPILGCYVPTFPPTTMAGGEVYLYRFLKYMSKDFDCRVYINADLTEEVDYELDGIKVSSDFSILNDVDIMITQFQSVKPAEIFAKKNAIPLVQIIHNEWSIQLSKYADLIIYNSDWMMDREMREVDRLGCDAYVVHPPAPLEDVYVRPEGDYITLVNASKIKGVDIATELAKRFPKEKFLFVKGGYGVQEIPKLKNVKVIDVQKDMREVYKQSKIVLVPSMVETFGMVAYEAATCGIPVIASSTFGLIEALGEAGIYPDKRTPDDWEKTLKMVLDNYKNYKDRMKLLPNYEGELKMAKEILETL